MRIGMWRLSGSLGKDEEMAEAVSFYFEKTNGRKHCKAIDEYCIIKEIVLVKMIIILYN